MRVIQAAGKRKNKIGSRGGVLRIAAVDGVAREDRPIAKILVSAPAIRATSIRAAKPRHADAQPRGQFLGRTLHNFPDDLVAGNHLLAQRRQLAFNDMQVRAAHATRTDSQHDVPRLQSGPWHVSNGEGPFQYAVR